MNSEKIKKSIEKLEYQLRIARAIENNWMRDLKHAKPSPVIKKIVTTIYDRGFYLPYTALRCLELWISWKGPITPKFYLECIKHKIHKSEQSSRNEIVRLRRMGVVIKNNKLVIIEVKCKK